MTEYQAKIFKLLIKLVLILAWGHRDQEVLEIKRELYIYLESN